MAQRYLPSKRLIDLKDMERRAFSVKQYDQAALYVQMAESTEVEERDAHY